MATYVLTVNGVAKSIKPGWSIVESANGRNRMEFSIDSLDGTFRVANDDAIIFTEDGTRIFGGLVDRPAEAGFGGSSASAAIAQRIAAADYNVYASREFLTAEIAAGTLKAALTVVASALSAFGVALDVAQVAGPTLPALSYNNRPIVDVLNELGALASGTGSTSYVWEIDYTKTLRAFASDTQAAPFNIADGDGNVVGDISVEQPRSSNYANYIRLYGGTGLKDETDTFTGDGVTTTFTLTYTLSSSYGTVTVAGATETLGPGATWTYDAATNRITRAAGAPALSAAISIKYVAAFPRVVIADGGLPAANRVTRVYTVPDVFDAAVLQALANAYLARDMASPKTVTYGADYSKTGLHPGQHQTIASTKRSLSGDHLITDVRIRHIGGSIVQRQVTAVSTKRLPATIREQYQQAFGGGASAAAATGITVVTGGTYLSSPASLGGSDTLYRAADSWVRVPNAQPYVAPATMSVKIRGTVAAHQAVNVSVRLRDEVNNVTAASAGPTGATATPASYVSTTGSVVAGRTYWLQMQSGTVGVPVTALGQVEGA